MSTRIVRTLGNPHTVYLFGAGTSRCAGVPTIREFLPAAERAFRAGLPTGEMTQEFRAALEDWKRLPQATIEDFFVWADLEDRLDGGKDIALRTRRTRYLIAKTIAHARVQDPKQTHLEFLRRIQGRRQFGSEAIITLNWDLVFEDAEATMPGLRFDYGSPGVHLYDRVEKDPQATVVPLLKLHGSLNWMSCHACKRLYVLRRPDYLLQDLERTDFMECVCQGAGLDPLMVPPSSQKFDGSVAEGILEPVWLRARKLLRECVYLVVAGYSFPPTDVQFKMFLVDALARNQHLEAIFIVSSPKYGSERHAHEDRYAGILSSLNRRLEFVYERFEDLVRAHDDSSANPFLGSFRTEWRRPLERIMST